MNEIIVTNTVTTSNLKWWHFRQNNSGGSFTVNDMVAEDIFVQARTAKEAQDIAEEITSESGKSWCLCCGERWYIDACEDEGFTVPTVYETPINLMGKEMFRDEARLHFWDGRIEKYFYGTTKLQIE